MKRICISLFLLSFGFSAFAKDSDVSLMCQELAKFIIKNNEPVPAKFEAFLESNEFKNLSLDPAKVNGMKGIGLTAYERMLEQINLDPSVVQANCREVFEGAGKRILSVAQEIARTSGLVKNSVGSEIYSKIAAMTSPRLAKIETYSDSCDGYTTSTQTTADCMASLPVLSLPQGFRDFMANEERKISSKTESYSTDDCNCLARTRLKNKKLDLGTVNKEADQIESRFDKLIQKATGIKLINEYAALSEDLQYYATIDAWVMREGASTQFEKKKLCQDPADFEKAVKQLCDKNGTSEGSAERLSALLGSFDSGLSKVNFATGLKTLVKDIETFTIDSRNVTAGKPNILTRTEYDSARQVLSKEEPQVQVANDIVTMMLLDEGGMKVILMDHIATGKSPLHGAMDILVGKNPEHAKFIFSKLEQKYSSDNQAFKQLKKEIGTSGFEKKVDMMFHVALNLNPGFKNLMNNGELFKKTASFVDFKDRDHVDVLSVMNRQKKVFNAHMKGRCEDVQKHFAEAVCTKPEVARKRVGPREMLNIIEMEKDFNNGSKDAKDIALCRMSEVDVSDNSFYAKLSMANMNPYEASDYLDRKLNPHNQRNGLAQLAQKASSDPRFASRLSEAAEKYDYARVGVGEYKTSNQTASANNISFSKSNNNSSAEAKTTSTYETSSEHKASLIAPSVYEQTNKSMAQTHVSAPTTVIPSVAFQTGATTESVAFDKKNEVASKASYDRLSKELASSEDKAKVTSHMSNINEADAQEILRLRDQAMKDQQTISDLRLEEEKKKAEALKNDYEQLKARLENLERPVERTASTQGHSSGRGIENSIPRFETGTLAAPQATTGGSTGGRVPASTTSFAGSGSVQEFSGSANAAATGAKTSIAQKEHNDARLGMGLVVVASVGSDGKERSDDPNHVLINYLTKNEPTVSQLQELKNSGLLYTEEDSTNDGKKIQIKKLIKFSELSAEAKVLIEKKLASIKVQEVKRNYSRQALMLELFTISIKKSPLSVKKAENLKL